MVIKRENLIAVLECAIDAEQEAEKEMGYSGDSALLAGWKEVRRALQDGEHVEVG